MGDLTTTGGGSGLVGLLHSTGGLAIPKPFEREIHLFDSHVAGTTHIEGIDELEPHLEVGEKLLFFREPENPYDPNAIELRYKKAKLGYVPRDENGMLAVMAHYGHAGVFEARVLQVDSEAEPWRQVRVGIYVTDAR